MRLVTASSLQRYFRCPSAAVLPKFDHHSAGAEFGTRLHSWVEAYVSGGADSAKPLETEDIEQYARNPYLLRALDEIGSLGGARTEVKFAGDPLAGEAMEGPPNLGHRDYSWVPAGWIAGTADIVVDCGDAVKVIDLKTGHTDPPPAHLNEQLKFLGWAAARALGKEEAHVSILRVWPGGDAAKWQEEFRLDAFDLDEEQDRLAELLADIHGAKADPESRASVGEACRWCDSLPFCPAAKAWVRAALGDGFNLESPDECGKAWCALEAMEATAKRLRQFLEARARLAPYQTPDGRTVQLKVRSGRESIDAGKAMPVLEKYGISLPPSVTKTSLKKAAGKLYGDVMKDLADAGAIKVGTAKETVVAE